MRTQTGTGALVGNFEEHVMHRHGDDCRACAGKERDEGLTWGVADVVWDMDAHSASTDIYDLLDKVAAAWGAERGPRD